MVLFLPYQAIPALRTAFFLHLGNAQRNRHDHLDTGVIPVLPTPCRQEWQLPNIHIEDGSKGFPGSSNHR